MHQFGGGDAPRNRGTKQPFEGSGVVDLKEDEPFPFLLQTDQYVVLYFMQLESR